MKMASFAAMNIMDQLCSACGPGHYSVPNHFLLQLCFSFDMIIAEMLAAAYSTVCSLNMCRRMFEYCLCRVFYIQQ